MLVDLILDIFVINNGVQEKSYLGEVKKVA